MAKIISALDANEMSCETFGTKIEPFLAAVDWQLIVGVKMKSVKDIYVNLLESSFIGLNIIVYIS